jgi:hypothetical protein
MACSLCLNPFPCDSLQRMFTFHCLTMWFCLQVFLHCLCGFIFLCGSHVLKSIFWAGVPTSIESLSPLCFVSNGSTIMPKKEMKESQDNSWVKETSARLLRMQQQIDRGHDGSNISNDSWERVATQPIYDLRSGLVHSSSRSAPLSGQETAELAYRMSGEAISKSIFNPWKNTSMICGRPVQVLHA